MEAQQFAYNVGASRQALADEMKRRALLRTITNNPDIAEAVHSQLTGGGPPEPPAPRSPGVMRGGGYGGGSSTGPNPGAALQAKWDQQADAIDYSQEKDYFGQPMRPVNDAPSGTPTDTQTQAAIRDRLNASLDQSAAIQHGINARENAAGGMAPVAGGYSGAMPGSGSGMSAAIAPALAAKITMDISKARAAGDNVAVASLQGLLGGGTGGGTSQPTAQPSELSRIVTAPGSDTPILTNRTGSEIGTALAAKYGNTPEQLQQFGADELAYGNGQTMAPANDRVSFDTPGAPGVAPDRVSFDTPTGAPVSVGTGIHPTAALPSTTPAPASGTATAPADDPSGALAGATDGDKAVIKGLVDYRIPLPSGMALRAPYWQNILSRAAQYDPTFDPKEYSVRQAVRKDFTSGGAAKAIRSFNTAIDHIGKLSEAVLALNNGGNQWLNAAVNYGKEKLGGSGPRGVETTATAVEGELANAFKNSGATDQEIKAWRENFKLNSSQGQMKKSIDSAIALLGGRLGALRQQYSEGLGKPVDFNFLAPHARAILQSLGADVDAIDGPAAGAREASPGQKIGRFYVEEVN